MARSPQDVAQSIKRAQNRHHRALDSALTSLGVSLVQWDALRRLDGNPEASLHDLARLTFQSDQAFGTLAVRMADRGLIERVAGPGRAVRLAMTDRGREVLAKGSVIADRVLADSFAELSPRQLNQLGLLLERLRLDE